MNKSKTLFLVSLGCPKNLVDSELMLGMLEKTGYSVCETPEEAQLILVNTCGFIQSAVEEAVDQILELASLKLEDPTKLLVVTGCLVQRYGKDLSKEMPEVDLFIGTDGFQNIISQIDNLLNSRTQIFAPLVDPAFLMDSSLPRRISTPAHRAYLKITEGCSNCCSYCMIPSIRGGLRSRTVADIISETKMHDSNHVKELTLIAQDLTAYGIDFNEPEVNLVALLKEIVSNSTIPWIRLLYLYPARLSEQLLDLMVETPRILPYFDIPLQHVSDRILKLMNRPYSLKESESLIERIRHKLPQAAIRTTFMVGFPGETQEDVNMLARFMERYELDHVGIFTYSNEEGCKATSLPDHCLENIKEDRRRELMASQSDISKKKNKRFIGRSEKVLVEGISKETDLLVEGRTRFQAADIDGCVYINSGECNPGDIVDVKFSEAHIYDLVGEIV
jgi:ribosomal protein S12 methylthiotransferase